MDLIREQATSRRMATILITHDLGLAAEYCDRLIVMHAGHVVESGPVSSIFKRPAHPYTSRLIDATPTMEAQLDDLQSIPGSLPDLRKVLPPCRFSARCTRYESVCDGPLPRRQIAEDHSVACWRPM